MTQTTPTSQPAKKQSTLLPWPPIVAIVFVVATYLGASILGEACLIFFGFINHWDMKQIQSWLTDSNTAQFFNVLLVYGALAAATYLFLRGHKITLRAVGLVWPRLRDIGVMMVGAPVYVLGYAILLSVMTALFPSINTNQQQQLGFQHTASGSALLLTFVSLVVLPPLVEEFVMRGFLFTSLLKRFKFIGATLITSVLFASAHLQFGSGAPLLWVAALDTFILSLVLCFMRYKTGSLWPGIMLHALKNGVAFLMLFVFHIA